VYTRSACGVEKHQQHQQYQRLPNSTNAWHEVLRRLEIPITIHAVSPQTLEVTLDPTLKKKAAKVLDGLGLDMESAVRVFLTKVVATHSIPFALAEEPEAYRFSAKETKDILTAKRESQKAGMLSGPFTTAESLITHLRQVKA
jgi:addiction module RelB/DinJ family antitoxin